MHYICMCRFAIFTDAIREGEKKQYATPFSRDGLFRNVIPYKFIKNIIIIKDNNIYVLQAFSQSLNDTGYDRYFPYWKKDL